MSSNLLRRGSQAKKKELERPESKERQKKDSKELSRELPEAPKGASSHDPPSLPRDYELPRSGDTLWPGFDGASMGRRWGVGGGNICRRRGPQKLLSKLRS